MSIEKKLLGTTSGGDAPNVEDVFSTYLYEGTGSALTITNGIDLDGEGGMVWIKDRDLAKWHKIFDTSRGVNKALFSNETDGESTVASTLTSFNANGFALGAGGGGNNNSVNESTKPYASWTFRKAPRFFDVVTYTGTGAGTAGRTISHNLGVAPGMIIVKALGNISGSWAVYHRSNGATKWQFLNYNWGTNTSNTMWYDTEPTSTEFTIGSDLSVNGDTTQFVAYLFAHDPDGENDDGMIACGSYTGNGSTSNFINLGWEPQYLLIKCSSNSSTDWLITDKMRGSAVGGNDAVLMAHLSNSEISTDNRNDLSAQGFYAGIGGNDNNATGRTYIYMAIRAPMMVEPEAGTEVFKANYGLDSASNNGKVWEAGFPVDMYFRNDRTGGSIYLSDRVRGSNKFLVPHGTQAEGSVSYSDKLDNQTGVYSTNAFNYSSWGGWMFKRAKGFFDVVAYSGNGTAGRTVNHSLGVVPEMMWVKQRDATRSWAVYNSTLGTGKFMKLETADAPVTQSGLFDTTPNTTTFTVETNTYVNISGGDYIAYLFATLAGVSKVGSYTGTGAVLDIDCGFSGGARFILIKPTSTTGSWYFFDSARGITTGNDPYLYLNQTNAEVTFRDGVDPLSSGFTLTTDATWNSSGVEYIFLAIA